MVQLKPVQGSKQVAAYGYDPASQVLAVQFVNSPGVVYHYRDVSAETAEAFDKAESKGSAMATLIRGKFDFTRITVDEKADAEAGFSLIEVLIVLAICGILLALGLRYVNADRQSLSFGFHGVTETRCIDGYKFVVGFGGQARQVLDEKGAGVRCTVV